MLEILTPAAETDLIQLATVKAHLRPAPVGTTEDARLADLIRWASAAINRYCRRTFARQEYRETLPGSGLQTLMLSRTPVEADAITRLVTLVTLNGATITDYRVEDGAAGFLWRQTGWPETLGARGLYSRRVDRTLSDRRDIVVEYWAGYQMPGETPADGAFPLPDDIERAALLTVLHYFRNDGKDHSVISTSSTESEGERSRTVTVGYDSSGSRAALGDPFLPIGPLPREAIALLKGYRR